MTELVGPTVCPSAPEMPWSRAVKRGQGHHISSATGLVCDSAQAERRQTWGQSFRSRGATWDDPESNDGEQLFSSVSLEAALVNIFEILTYFMETTDTLSGPNPTFELSSVLARTAHNWPAALVAGMWSSEASWPEAHGSPLRS